MAAPPVSVASVRVSLMVSTKHRTRSASGLPCEGTADYGTARRVPRNSGAGGWVLGGGAAQFTRAGGWVQREGAGELRVRRVGAESGCCARFAATTVCMRQFASKRHGPCSCRRMAGVARFQDLVCWQLAMQLADLVDSMTSTGPAAANRAFAYQIRNAGTKAPAQIAEGWMRFYAADTANFLRMARASLGELQTHLERGRRRAYWSDEVFQQAWKLSERTIRVTTGFMKERLAAAQRQKRTRTGHAHSAPGTRR
ncbi:MAG: hypothetical protein DMF85_01550 [Acidobacteria bacterium]|nr:MAG: hypothetical protein DMF85_01550 [Acidobacteriota bacterium]